MLRSVNIKCKISEGKYSPFNVTLITYFYTCLSFICRMTMEIIYVKKTMIF